MFDAKKETQRIIDFIKDYFSANNLKGVVLGISGGKDSAVVSALFATALGAENVIGVTLPCHSKEDDRTDARAVADAYGYELIDLDLTEVFDSFIKEAGKLDVDPNIVADPYTDASINLKPRLRMASVYYLAALYSKIRGGTYIVAGTSNKCELYVGYFTKGGDSTYDIGVLTDLTVEEVIKVGEVLGVPKQVLYKAPSDGISAKSDEEKMGVTYDNITKVIEGTLNQGEEYEKIQKLHARSSHKFHTPRYIKQ